MAMNFGKSNRSIAFNPTSAFPLDARSYFDSYEKALKAAENANTVGGRKSRYYFGQTVAVVENNIAKLYIIQPGGKLVAVGNEITINPDVFIYNEDGKLSLYDFQSAVAGAQLTKGADGKLQWIKPDTTTVEGLSAEVESLRTDLNDLVNNTYTKHETDIKISTAITTAPYLKRIKVNSVDNIDPSVPGAEGYIYMVPTGLENDDNKYYEYIIIDGVIEFAGTWEVSLNNYITKNTLATELERKINKEEGKTLIPIAELDKLSKIPTGAEPNFITGVNANNFQVSNKILDLSESRISELKTIDRTLNGYTTDEGNKIIGLREQVANLAAASYITLDQFNKTVGNLDVMLENKTNVMQEIEDINTRLTWGEILE